MTTPDHLPPAVPGPDGSVVLDHLAALAAAQRAFAEVLDRVDLTAPVPGCAPWTVTDLALHLGGVHRWAASMARGVEADDADPTSPRESAALRAFYTEQAALLRDTLAEVGTEAPALTLVGPGPAGFWRRRQLHETLVHLVDLERAAAAGGPDTGSRAGTGTGTEMSTGASVGGDDVRVPDVWADTVDEVVTVMAPRQVRLGRTPALGRPVALAATDTARTWVLGGDPDMSDGPGGTDDTGATGATGVAEATGTTVAATVHGPARLLALLVWGRLGADHPGLRVTGERAALDEVLAGRLTP
ncbi:MAG TPA: maleylpyruvate isomerase N-terminal domain-containing protein [Cellulomonas sp.]